MEDTLVINGITYIKQSHVAEMEQNLENIRQVVNSALNDVNALVNSQSVTQLNNQVTKKKVETPKNKHNIAFKLRESKMIPYKISKMDDLGNFYSIHNRKYAFTIRDVLLIRKEFNTNTTNRDIKKLSEKTSLNDNNIHRIIYNLEIGTFDKYIKEWLESVNEIKVTGHHAFVENNPQKRKESGMYV